MAEIRGKCPCGKIAGLRAVERHALGCRGYQDLYGVDPTSPLLDLEAAYRVSQLPDAQREEQEALIAAREVGRVAYRAKNAQALSGAQRRWSGGASSFSSTAGADHPVSIPAGGVIVIPLALVGSARGRAVQAMAEQ